MIKTQLVNKLSKRKITQNKTKTNLGHRVFKAELILGNLKINPRLKST